MRIVLERRRAKLHQIGTHRGKRSGNFPSYSDSWPNRKGNSVGIRSHPRTDCSKSVARNRRDKRIDSYRSCSKHNLKQTIDQVFKSNPNLAYLATRLAAAIIDAFVVINTLRTRLIQLIAPRTHALEAAQRIDALGRWDASARLLDAFVHNNSGNKGQSFRRRGSTCKRFL